MANVDDLIKRMDSQYGAGVVSEGVTLPEAARAPTGILPFDLATGGFPLGKISIVFGPESCKAWDTFIPFEVWSKDGSCRQNHKGGTIEKLYNRFHGKDWEGNTVKVRRETEDSNYFVKSIDENNCIISTKVLDVVHTGHKECFEITTSDGQVTKSTKDHKYYIGDLEYRELSELNVGDTVYIHNNTRVSNEKNQYKSSASITVRSHPTSKPTQTYKDTNYYQIPKHRIVVEASINDLSIDMYVDLLNRGFGSQLKGIPSNLHVHHKDHNPTNNCLSNLVLLSNEEHRRLHSKCTEEKRNLSFIAQPTEIVSIVNVGLLRTYDITCEKPYNNYIANGFVVHNSLKTTIALKAIGVFQKSNPDKKCVFVDLEASYVPEWGEKLGVNNDELVYILPQYAEQAVDIIEGFLYAEDVGLVVVDSLAALITANELDSSADKAVVGGSALVVGKLYRKAVMAISTGIREGRAPTLICINQIRFKVGCFTYNSRVLLADGTTKKIGTIVNKKSNDLVLSMDASGVMVPKKITDWHNNGVGEDWLYIHVSGGFNGNRVLKVTKHHSIFTPKGEVLAESLIVGDNVLSYGETIYSDEQHEIILGSLLGDGSLRFEGDSPRPSITLGHGLKQLQYLKWKCNLLQLNVSVGKLQCNAYTRKLSELAKYKSIRNKTGGKHIPVEFIDKLTPLAIAIWYMDDGDYRYPHNHDNGYGHACISCQTLPLSTMKLVASKFKSLGLGYPYIKEGKGFRWSGTNSKLFMEGICNFIPECMGYKLKKGYACGDNLNIKTVKPYLYRYPVPITKIESINITSNKFDLTVEGNHNYIVDGVVVHNSYGNPEVQPGGKAFQFASALTIRMYGKDEFDKKVHATLPSWKLCSGIIQKWKVPVTARTFEFKVSLLDETGYDIGTANDWNTLSTYLKDLGYLVKGDKAGQWFLFDEEYKTLNPIKQRLNDDLAFNLMVRQSVIDSVLGGQDKEALEVDKETGEIL